MSRPGSSRYPIASFRIESDCSCPLCRQPGAYASSGCPDPYTASRINPVTQSLRAPPENCCGCLPLRRKTSNSARWSHRRHNQVPSLARRPLMGNATSSPATAPPPAACGAPRASRTASPPRHPATGSSPRYSSSARHPDDTRHENDARSSNMGQSTIQPIFVTLHNEECAIPTKPPPLGSDGSPSTLHTPL